jgi:hypothetical protein
MGNFKRMVFFFKKSFNLLLILLVFLFLLMCIKDAYAPPPPPAIPTYTWSAHGNTSDGVNRTSIAAFGYSIGNCAHCHEQHASIGGVQPEPSGGAPQEYELFKNLFVDQISAFCYGCHDSLTSGSQYQVSMPNQYDYSWIAGHDTTSSNNCPDNIKYAFRFIQDDCSGSRNNNCNSSVGSAHCLEDIKQYIKNTPSWNFGAGPTVNPCSGCHNPHRAQQDTHTTGRLQGQKLASVVSRPSAHSKDNNAWELWGDDLDERMSYYALNRDGGGGTYQAPCQYPWSSTCSLFEPDGSSTADGSNLFDTVTFCQDCHGNSSNPVHSTRLGRDLDVINWGSDPVLGNQHGQNSDNGVGGGGMYLNAPYPRNAMMSASPDYVLSCLDCHEPHGSPNEFLLRQEVNGVQVNVVHGGPVSGGDWCGFCSACHEQPHGGPNCAGMAIPCWNCHTHRNTKPTSLF